MEKFTSFKIGALEFIDSLNFLNTSLDKLVKNLQIKAKNEKKFQRSFQAHI